MLVEFEAAIKIALKCMDAYFRMALAYERVDFGGGVFGNVYFDIRYSLGWCGEGLFAVYGYMMKIGTILWK